MFKNNSKVLNKKEKLEYIRIYCSDELKKTVQQDV